MPITMIMRIRVHIGQTKGSKGAWLDLHAKGCYRPRHAARLGPGKQPFWFALFKSLVVVATLTAIFHTMFGIAVVSGSSMTPTLYEGDCILFWKLSSSYRYGELVMIKTQQRNDYVKRVCAVPGDVLSIDDENGIFLRNGEAQAEPYLHEKTYSKPSLHYPLSLAAKEYFVLGDHRSDSFDSRNYGAVNADQIHGKVLMILLRGIRVT